MKILFILLVPFIFLNAVSLPEIPAVVNSGVSLATQNILDDEIDEFDGEFAPLVADPLSGYNRFMTNINDALYRLIFKHIFVTYDALMPNIAQTGIENFFTNLKFPVRFVNNIFQAKFSYASDEIKAFVLNTTIGLGGFIDIAGKKGIKIHKEDFGQTLGHWGVGSGFHIVWPLVGHSNLRDSIGLGVDYFFTPSAYGDKIWAKKPMHDGFISFSLNSLAVVNKSAKDPYLYENLTKGVLDLYPFLRDAYEQRRRAQIKE